MIYVQHSVNGKKYTTVYMHLKSFNVDVGDTVFLATVIAYSGGGVSTMGYDRCTTGAHLHISVSKGYYTSYANYVANLINPPGYPGKGAYFNSRTQWFG